MNEVAVEAKIEGLKELTRKLAALSAMDQGKVIRNAGNAAGTVVVKRARATVPTGSVPHKTYKGRWVSPGFLSRSIKKSSRLSRDKNAVFVSIGVKGEAFYGTQFLELGTSTQPAQPWLRPALDDSKKQAIAIFREKILANIKKISSKK